MQILFSFNPHSNAMKQILPLCRCVNYAWKLHYLLKFCSIICCSYIMCWWSLHLDLGICSHCCTNLSFHNKCSMSIFIHSHVHINIYWTPSQLAQERVMVIKVSENSVWAEVWILRSWLTRERLGSAFQAWVSAWAKWQTGMGNAPTFLRS